MNSEIKIFFFIYIHKINSIDYFLLLFEYSTNMIFQEYNIYKIHLNDSMGCCFFFKIKIITYSLLIKKRHILKLTLIFP